MPEQPPPLPPLLTTSSPWLAREADVLVMRADPELARRWYLGFVLPGVPLVVLLMIFTTVKTGWRALLVIAGVAAVVFPLVYLGLQVRVRLAAARLDSKVVSTRTWYGWPRRILREAVARIVLVSADLSTVSARPPVDYMLFVDRRGRCRLRVWTSAIPPADRAAFAAAFGVPVETRDKPMTPRRMREEFPGSMSWHLAHQWLFAFLIVGTGFLVTVAVLLVLSAMGRLQ